MTCRNAGVRLACVAGTLATTAAIAALNSPAAVSARQTAAGPTVKVRIEGAQRTLLDQTTVPTHSGYITRMGAPAGMCSATSAAGALQAATHGGWSGSWSTSFHDYFVKIVLGDNEGGKHSYWDVLVNHVAASTGVCGIHLHNGEQLLFAAVPTTGPGYPLAVRLLSKPIADRPFRVQVVYYDAKGAAKPLAGVRVVATAVDGGSRHAVTSPKTGAAGKATMTERKLGPIQLEVAKHGYIRSAPLIAQVMAPGA